jgi:hypothetical protein
MIYEENLEFLKKKNVNVYNFLVKTGNLLNSEKFSEASSRNGAANITITNNERTIYLHSQYDPQNESIKIVDSIQGLDSNKHVFFYGLGLGYHIEEFQKRYPAKKFTLYEPLPQVFQNFLNRFNLSKYSALISNVYLEWSNDSIEFHLAHFMRNLSKEIVLFVHPAYERIFSEDVARFQEKFRAAVFNWRANTETVLRFSNLWTVNSLLNFRKTVCTPNLLREKKSVFRNKPAIIASAGPSLVDEFDNLREIKKNRSAYIFAVGSANKALLAEGIYPDAVIAYDPETGINNLDIFREIIEGKISDIPLIYGTSLGCKTVTDYPGPLLHMFINQDQISPYLLNNDFQKHEVIMDAPSIADVTLEVLNKLECNPIILVGQNFAFRNEQYYAKGISYETRASFLTEEERNDLVSVESVDGGIAYTLPGHIMAKETMERYLRFMSGVEVINTTQGGAKIEGTLFSSLDEIMENKLNSIVVEDEWYVFENSIYDLKSVEERINGLYESLQGFESIVEEMPKILKKISTLTSSRKLEASSINKHLKILEISFQTLVNNDFFKVVIKPLTQFFYEHLALKIEDIREELNLRTKGIAVVDSFTRFLYEVNLKRNFIKDTFLLMQRETSEYINSIGVNK